MRSPLFTGAVGVGGGLHHPPRCPGHVVPSPWAGVTGGPFREFRLGGWGDSTSKKWLPGGLGGADRGGGGAGGEERVPARDLGAAWPLTDSCARVSSSPRERSERRAPGVHGRHLEDHVL